MKKVYVIRHAKSTMKRLDFWGFWDRVDTEKGFSQCEAVSKNIEKEEITVWVTSPLLRARETLSIIKKNLGTENPQELILDNLGPCPENVPVYDWHMMKLIEKGGIESLPKCWSDYLLKNFPKEYQAEGEWFLSGIQQIFDTLWERESGIGISHNPIIQSAVYQLTGKQLGNIPNCSIVEFSGISSPEEVRLL